MNGSEANDLHTFLEYRGICSSDIPNIDIYMDQLLTFFDNSYAFLRRDGKNPILTKAMINNYVKSGIMNKPIKKKYNKKQIKKLIMIYHLKQILAINDIQKLFDQASKSELSADAFYDKFLAAEQTVYKELTTLYAGRLESNKTESSSLEDSLDSDSLDSDSLEFGTSRDFLLDSVIALTTEACAKKRLAEKLLDQLQKNA